MSKTANMKFKRWEICSDINGVSSLASFVSLPYFCKKHAMSSHHTKFAGCFGPVKRGAQIHKKKKCVNLGSFMWELVKWLVGSNAMQSNLHV